MAAFLFKVFTLTIRTIAKPLSKRVEAYVLEHPTLRKPVVDLAQVSYHSVHTTSDASIQDANHPAPWLPSMLCPCLQVLHRLEVRVNRGAEGKVAKVFVGDLSEENALELAGKVISESFIWLVSASYSCLVQAAASQLKLWLASSSSYGCKSGIYSVRLT